MQWIAADAKVKYCDGSNWKDTTQSEGGSCSGVAAGTINYSSGDLFYCNSSAKWIKMNSATNLGSCAGVSAGTINWDSGAMKLRMCNGSTWFDLAAAAYNYSVILASNENDVLLTNKLTALGWNGSSTVSVLVTVNSDVVIGSTSTSTAALRSGNLPAGSSLKIINNGRIQGKGGNGGDNLTLGDPAGDGYPGGPALEISLNIDLDNASGNIWGGGGGGGSGQAGSCNGGGGGGGAGSLPGWGGSGWGGSVIGEPGTFNSGGEGGPTGCGPNGFDGLGGRGGDPGEPGSVGETVNWEPWSTPAGLGGAAGNAIKLNGKSINWLGGNSGTQVRGPVN